MSFTINEMIGREEIKKRILELGAEIEKDYEGKGENLILVGLLKGSVMFMSDLMKEIHLPFKIDFMSVSSYGEGEARANSTGVVKILKDMDFDVKGQDILIIEDIIDTGLTLKYVKGFLYNKGAHDVKVCTLLDKPSRRKNDIKGDYIGFSIPDEFVLGYGLDFDQRYRNLDYVATVEFDKE